MTTSTDTPMRWMINDGTREGAGKVIKTERGWERDWPNGTRELLQAFGGLAELDTTPIITEIENPDPGTYYIDQDDVLRFLVHFEKPVVVTGSPTLQFTVGELETQYDATFAEQIDDNTLAFDWTATTTEGDVVEVTGISPTAGGATILDEDDNAVGTDLPADYAGPGAGTVTVVAVMPTTTTTTTPAPTTTTTPAPTTTTTPAPTTTTTPAP